MTGNDNLKLRYVNELLALPPGQRNVGDLKADMSKTLALAKPWLQAADFQALAVELVRNPCVCHKVMLIFVA